jgi:hypothetical protein
VRKGSADGDQLERIRKQYPTGTVIELIRMDDPQAPAKGTRGVVRGVDDIGSLLVDWDNGSGLSVVPGVDTVQVVKEREKK